MLGLLRPVNAVMAAAAVFVGAVAVRHPVGWCAAGLGALSTFAASCAANSVNDAADVVADRINRPERPIPSGRVSPRAAVWTGLFLFAASAALAAPLGARALALVGAWVVLTTLYSVTLERLPLLGNVVVALVAASPLLMGGLTQGVPGAGEGPAAGLLGSAVVVETGRRLVAAGERLAVMFALAALLHLAREFVKSAEDEPGDSVAGKRTIAVALGPGAALAWARVTLLVTMWAAAAPYLLGLMGLAYVGVLVPLEATLAWLVVASSRDRTDPAKLRQVSNGLKVVMLLGLIAFVAGSYS